MTPATRNRLPRAVIFDMDGLLADTEPTNIAAYVGIMRDMGLDVTEEGYRQAVTIGGISVRDLYDQLGGDPAQWPSAHKAKARQYRAVLSERGRLMPGVIELLESLRAAEIPTAIATSGARHSLEIILDVFRIARYFDVFVAKEDARAEKPDPDAYILAAERLGVRPEECVALEDSPRGVEAAIRAGMKCIAVPTAQTIDGDFSLATLVVRSLEEVSLDTLRCLFH